LRIRDSLFGPGLGYLYPRLPRWLQLRSSLWISYSHSSVTRQRLDI